MCGTDVANRMDTTHSRNGQAVRKTCAPMMFHLSSTLRMRDAKHPLFRWEWWSVNALLAALMVSSMCAGIREYSARRYLNGFADAVVPESAGAEQKVEAILAWMRNGPARNRASEAASLAARDPEATLNYQQLLEVCGTATNAFLNLARSSGLSARRLLLLTPEHRAKHV